MTSKAERSVRGPLGRRSVAVNAAEARNQFDFNYLGAKACNQLIFNENSGVGGTWLFLIRFQLVSRIRRGRIAQI